MRETLYQYLAARSPAPEASSEELLGQILPGKGEDEAFGHFFLARLLADDPRFEEMPGGARWRLAEGHLLEMPLAEAPFVVVDLETTGQQPEQAGITEIGAVRLVGGRETDRLDSLVNPGRPIPPYVAKLTGIDDAMVAEAPTIESLMPAFRRFAADAVLVAHNAAFDAKLLDHACRSILACPLGMPALCTFKLARRLVPELTKASLDGLAAHFGLARAVRHRAMADAELTALVLERLLRILEERGARTIADVLLAQEEADAPRRLELSIPRRQLESLPEERGVYWLLSSSGETLLVGHAGNVREHVAGYYLATTHLSNRQIEMLSAATAVGCRETASEMETMIVEAEEVRRRKPLYNRADRHLPRGSFIKVTRKRNFPRVFVASRVSGDGALYLGPVKGKVFADEAAALLARLYMLRTCPGRLVPDPAAEPCELGPAGACSSPCNAQVDARTYRRLVHDLERDLNGDGNAVRQRLARDSDGKLYGRDSGLIGRLLRIRRRRHWLVNQHHYLAALAGRGGTLILVLIVGGMCRRIARITKPAELEAFIASVDSACASARVPPFEADVSTIMAHWIRRTDDGDGSFVFELDVRDLAASLAEAAAELAPVVASLG